MIIKAKQITKSYQTGSRKLEVLKGVNLSISEGEIVSIMGPSGCGKSTLLNILGILDRLDSGDLWIENKKVSDLSDRDISQLRNKYIGFVFQFHHLLPEFSVIENLMIPQLIKGVNEDKAKDRCMKLLEVVDLYNRYDHNPAELSGGERQRVAVLRALVNHPRLVLADEPTGNLDIESGLKIIDLIKQMRDRDNNSFLIATHNPDVAVHCDRHLKFKDGILVEGEW